MRHKQANKMHRPAEHAPYTMRRNAPRSAATASYGRTRWPVARAGRGVVARHDGLRDVPQRLRPALALAVAGRARTLQALFIASCAPLFLLLERIDCSCLSPFQQLVVVPPFPRFLPLLFVGTSLRAQRGGVVGCVGSGRRAGPDPAHKLHGVVCMRCLARSLYPRCNDVRMLRRTFGSCKGQNDSSTFTAEYRAFLRNFAAAQQAAYAGR